MKYLLDTNVLSEPLKAVPDQLVLTRMEQYRGNVVTAILVVHELYYGCYRLLLSRKRTMIERYINEIVLPSIPVLPYTEKAAEYHARERARLQALGKPPAFVDGQIAAIAYTNNAILVTRNSADFENFSGLQIENWHSG